MLLDNTPDYVFALCGAGLSGVAVAGLNYTRFGEHLARDMSHTDLQLVITEPRHQAQLADALPFVDLPGGVLVSDRFADGDDPAPSGDTLGAALDAAQSHAKAPQGQRRTGAKATSTCCGRCCSPPGPRPRPKRCAARSAACSRPATGCP